MVGKMAGDRRLLVLALLIPVLATVGHHAQRTTRDEISPFLGTWHGTSSCVAQDTACQDEMVVYHIAELPEKPGSVSVTADKLVSTRAVQMGTLEFRYDPEQRQLVGEYEQGVWRLQVEGGKIEGTLTRPSHLVFRRVSLRKGS